MSFRLLSVLLVVISLLTSAFARTAPDDFVLVPRAKKTISRVHVAERASEKHLLKKVQPEYPPEAQIKGLEGDVVFRIIIGKSGHVKEIHLRRGKPLFIREASNAVSQWQYEIYRLNGKPVEVETLATVRFRLPSKAGVPR